MNKEININSPKSHSRQDLIDFLKACQGEKVDIWNDWRKRNPEVKILFPQAVINFSHLNRVDLSGADLRGARLGASNFRLANFDNANMRFANLKLSDCTEATFAHADITSIEIWDTSFSEVDFSTTTLGWRRRMFRWIAF